MKKLLLVLAFMLYSFDSGAWIPAAVKIAHTPHSHSQKQETDGQEIYKHSLGALIGQKIKGCKVIDAFYWNHYINIICISDVNTFRKAKVPVYDWTEETSNKWGHYPDIDITEEVIEIFNKELKGN